MSQPTTRIGRDELYMMVARLFGMRSTCPRRQVGAIAVKNGRIIATGYVGAPTGREHCIDVGCEMENDHCVRTVHAEANVVAFSARESMDLWESTIYSTVAPCYTCAKLLVNAGIVELVYDEPYSDERGIRLLQALDVTVVIYDAQSSS